MTLRFKGPRFSGLRVSGLRVSGLAIAASGFTALLCAGAPHAAAAETFTRGQTVYISFTNDETRKIAATGIDGILDNPALRPHWYANPDKKSRDKVFYIPGRGLVVRTSAERLVEEAAAKPDGHVIIGFSVSRPDAPLTLATRWSTEDKPQG
ncbi:MAG: hypothetical protein QM673_05365 [Gordonia sp. (in: high G+C Gram-positive bacteria)]